MSLYKRKLFVSPLHVCVVLLKKQNTERTEFAFHQTSTYARRTSILELKENEDIHLKMTGKHKQQTWKGMKDWEWKTEAVGGKLGKLDWKWREKKRKQKEKNICLSVGGE